MLCSNLIPAQCLRRVLALHHRHDLERHQIRPAGYPALRQRDVVRFHQLEAAAQLLRNFNPSGIMRPFSRKRR